MATDERTGTEIDAGRWADYLDDLEAILRREISAERWAAAFKGTDTPAEAAEKLRELAADRPQPPGM